MNIEDHRSISRDHLVELVPEQDRDQSISPPTASPLEDLRSTLRGRPPNRLTSSPSRADYLTGYERMVADRVRDGWSCYLVSFVFDQLRGRQSQVLDQMKDHLTRVYSTLVTRVCRKPRTTPTDRLPILLGFADLPVFKRDRASSPLVRCNDGLHVHALVLLPPDSRLKLSLVDHLREESGRYLGGGLHRVDVRPVDRGHARVVDYAAKTVACGRLSYDDAVLVLPRAKSELGVH